MSDSLRKRFDSAFEAVAKAFPFEGYVDTHCYYQLKSIVEGIAKFRPDFKGLELLDVGSGPMDKTAILQQVGFKCSAADDLGDPWHQLGNNTDLILDFGRRMGINFHHQKNGDFSTPFPKGHFDVVTSISVIEHMHDTPRHILNAMGEYLKPGGLLVVSMPNSVNLRKRLSVLRGRTNYNPVDAMYYAIGDYRGHVREYTLAETRFIVERNGFDILRSSTFEHLAHSKLPPGLRQLYSGIGNMFPSLRSGLLVIAEKPQDWKPKQEDRDHYFRSISRAVRGQVTQG